jgi:AcrR family transcriptional regulator
MNMPLPKPSRTYRQGARAAAAEATATRILDAFERRVREDWFDQIRLEDVARDAGVAVPTIIRRFGNKDGLLEATWERLGRRILERRSVATGDIDAAVRVIVEDYELAGDLVVRALAQEDRHPAFKPVNDVGRASHYAWTAAVFSPWLDVLAPERRRRALDALVTATDLYVWKLARRDMGRSPAQVAQLMHDLIGGIIGEINRESIGGPRERK